MSLRDLIFSQQSVTSNQDNSYDSFILDPFPLNQPSFVDESPSKSPLVEPKSILQSKKKEKKQKHPRFSFDNNQYYENILNPFNNQDSDDQEEENEESTKTHKKSVER